MLQAPIVAAFYAPVNFYSFKLLVDGFGSGSSNLILPICLYIGSILTLETAWRISQFAWMKSQPSVRADILLATYKTVQGYPYGYFQDNFTGAISSKIKGIVDGYNNLWATIHHRLTSPVLQVFIGIGALGFVNIKITLFMSLWAVVFLFIMGKMSLKISKLSQITSEAKHSVLGKISDNIANIFTIFAFAKSKTEYIKIRNLAKTEMEISDQNQCKYEIKQTLLGTILYATMMFSLLFYMIYLRQKGEVTTGDLVFVLTLTWQLVNDIWNVVSNIGHFMHNLGDFKSSFSILSNRQENLDKPDAKGLVI